MNKIDEYKKKINYDVWADVTGIPFQQETEVASLPRKIFQDSIKEYHASNSKKRKKSGEDQ